VEFEWDEHKASSNEEKHDVSFHETATVFGNPLTLRFYDPDHSRNKNRLITFGESIVGRLIVVSHTERHEKTRIISA